MFDLGGPNKEATDPLDLDPPSNKSQIENHACNLGGKKLKNFHLISERRFEILDLHSALALELWK